MLNNQRQEDLLMWSHDAVCFIADWTQPSPPQEAPPIHIPPFFFTGFSPESPPPLCCGGSLTIRRRSSSRTPSSDQGDTLQRRKQSHRRPTSSQISWQDTSDNETQWAPSIMSTTITVILLPLCRSEVNYLWWKLGWSLPQASHREQRVAATSVLIKPSDFWQVFHQPSATNQIPDLLIYQILFPWQLICWCYI